LVSTLVPQQNDFFTENPQQWRAFGLSGARASEKLGSTKREMIRRVSASHPKTEPSSPELFVVNSELLCPWLCGFINARFTATEAPG
jgi:hypothetical protein